MTFLDHIIENLTKAAESHQGDGGFLVTAKVVLAKVTLAGIAPFFGVISAVFLTISNAQLNEALRTMYLAIAILFILMSLLWSIWKNKQTTLEMIESIKDAIKKGKTKPPGGTGGTDPGDIVN